jgi:hypothetical protein
MEMPKRTPALAGMAAAPTSVARMSIFVFIILFKAFCLSLPIRSHVEYLALLVKMYYSLNQRLATNLKLSILNCVSEKQLPRKMCLLENLAPCQYAK